jgi:hypothetical protein
MRRILIILLPALVVALGLASFCLLDVLPRLAGDVHMRNVTRELAEWQAEHSRISSPEDAVRAAEMLAYVQGYYVPANGYRGTPETEAALQTQRRATSEFLVQALRTHTGKDFGVDSEKWLEYLQPAKPDADATTSP